jgi:hypothetical protein
MQRSAQAVDVKTSAFRAGMSQPGRLRDKRTHACAGSFTRTRRRALELQHAINRVEQRKQVLVRNDVSLVPEPITTIGYEMPAAALDFHERHPSLRGKGYTILPDHKNLRLLLTPVRRCLRVAQAMLQVEELPTLKDRTLRQVYSLPCSTCGAQALPHFVREISHT